jgi:hypothetical protein
MSTEGRQGEERQRMLKKLLMGLGPVLTVAFAVTPVAAQAEGTHIYKNGTRIAEGVRVSVIGWWAGTSTLESPAGKVTCKGIGGGYVENPKGGGPGVGVAQTEASYECATAECPAETRAEGIINNSGNANGSRGWVGHIVEQEGTSRLETTGIEVVIGCWTAGPSGPGNVSTSERGSPLAPLLPFKGTSTPKLKNGVSAGKPSKVEFGPGSGELSNETVGGGKTTGSFAVLGYNEQELITTGA